MSYKLDTQKDFTNFLRNQIRINFPNEPNQTIGYYESLDADTMKLIKSKNEIKFNLKNYAYFYFK